MKSKPPFQIILFLAFMTLAGLFYCDKENIEIENEEVRYLSHVFDAQTFMESIERADEKFTGIFIKTENGQLQFETVILKEGTFKSIEPIATPEGTIAYINKEGLILSSEEVDRNISKDLQYWNDDFELAYFSWEEIRMLTLASERIYISGAQISIGNSIHKEEKGDTSIEYFTLKMEGDFEKPNSPNSNGSHDVMKSQYLLGLACPPYWRPDEGNEDDGG